jgi:hypothetical protein
MTVVYLASPMFTYGTGLYEENRRRVAGLFPGAELIVPADGLYPSARVFRQTYREHVGRCTDLVFFTAADLVIYQGMAEEIRYARTLGTPVWWLTADGLQPM